MGDLLIFRRPAVSSLPASGTHRVHRPPAVHVPDAAVPYVVTAHPGSVALVFEDVEIWVAPEAARDLARTLLRLATSAEKAARESGAE